jgi:hypothetical protein
MWRLLFILYSREPCLPAGRGENLIFFNAIHTFASTLSFGLRVFHFLLFASLSFFFALRRRVAAMAEHGCPKVIPFFSLYDQRKEATRPPA